MEANVSVKTLLNRKTPPELDDVPRIGLDENGALFKCVRSAEHWFKAYTETEKALQSAERSLVIERAKLALLGKGKLLFWASLVISIAHGVAHGAGW